jgi:hypothetical protein
MLKKKIGDVLCFINNIVLTPFEDDPPLLCCTVHISSNGIIKLLTTTGEGIYVRQIPPAGGSQQAGKEIDKENLENEEALLK